MYMCVLQLGHLTLGLVFWCVGKTNYLPNFCDLLNSQCLLLEPVSVSVMCEFEGTSYSTYSSRTVVPVN